MAVNHNAASQVLSETTQKVFQAYSGLNTDGKLALLYFLYEKMGDSITPAAPTSAEPSLAPKLLGDFYSLSNQEQLDVMRSIVNGDDSDYSRAYGALSPNNQLVVWYAWARGMGDTIVDMPDNYQATQPVNDALAQIEELDFEAQISLLREIASKMGYSTVQPIPSQAETGKTASL